MHRLSNEYLGHIWQLHYKIAIQKITSVNQKYPNREIDK